MDQLQTWRNFMKLIWVNIVNCKINLHTLKKMIRKKKDDDEEEILVPASELKKFYEIDMS